MIVLYVAGPFRGKNHWVVEQNIRRAEELALELWRLGGVAVICPHTNTRFFDGAAPDEVWLEGDLEIMRRCDAVVTVPGWGASTGACKEVAEMERIEKPIFHRIEDVKAWLEEFRT